VNNPLHDLFELLREIRHLLKEVLKHVKPRHYPRSSGGSVKVR